MLDGFLSESIVGRAVRSELIDVSVHNLRDWAKNRHRTVDDRPFGGGAGMVLKPEPLFEAIESLRGKSTKIIYLCPDGRPLNSGLSKQLAQESHLLLVSGHYEGIDERVREHLIHEEISIGDYVLTNGTLPAAVLLDAVVRYLPGALGKEQSLEQDSFGHRLLAYPQYTRPFVFREWAVPSVLCSGNHGAIVQWRNKQQAIKTLQRRPDLILKK